jgi:hypothetical protein
MRKKVLSILLAAALACFGGVVTASSGGATPEEKPPVRYAKPGEYNPHFKKGFQDRLRAKGIPMDMNAKPMIRKYGANLDGTETIWENGKKVLDHNRPVRADGTLGPRDDNWGKLGNAGTSADDEGEAGRDPKPL